MEAREHFEERLGEPSPGTLGEVLYAQRAGPLVAESDWANLVHAVAAGSQPALHALYDRANHLVFTLAVRITCSRETAEEVTLDVFHDVWRRAAAYDAANGTVLGWIMNQARSRSIDRVRFEMRKKRCAPPYAEEPADLAEPNADPREIMERREEGRELREALLALNAEEREAIECAFLLGLTHVEVAAQLQQPLGTVKTRIRSGLQKLRLALGIAAGNP
jgi:RNA polymerase sigma-70 factor (ECF subfamily)